MHTTSGARRPVPLTPGFAAQGGRPSPPSPNTPFPTSHNRARVGHACDRCRTMRTKCSGGTRCSKCVKDDAVCVYGDRKRERNRKDLAESVERINVLQDENNQLLSALRSITSAPNFSATGHENVLSLLSNYTEDENMENMSTPTESRSQTSSLPSQPIGSGSATSSKEERGSLKRGREAGEDRGEDRTASSVGSPGHQGELPKLVDLDKGMGASGFVGKMSEMSWMQRAREYLIKQPGSELDTAPAELDQHAKDAQTLTYFMDDLNLLSVDEEHVNPLQWPPYQVALILSEAFFHATQGAFHFILREQFLDRLVSHGSQTTRHVGEYQRWLAIANLVWAVGSKWLHLVNLDENFPDGHLVYYARARALGLDHRILFDHPDVDMVEGIGLLAFYLLINGSVSRAWNILGSAIRHATALGLHLKVADPSINEVERERRARAWYSLYNLEVFIAETTGRPQSIQAGYISVPLLTLRGHSYESAEVAGEESSELSKHLWSEFLRNARTTNENLQDPNVWSSITLNDSSVLSDCFMHHIRLCRISAEISDKLYTRASENAWSITQERIRQLDRDLRTWRHSLPAELKPDPIGEVQYDSRAQIGLAMYFQSVSMILHRPCLCEIKIDDESARSKEFNQQSARACIHAAMSLLDLAPDNPVAHEIMQLLPWSALLHYICQAGSVLLLELCLDCQHYQGQTSEILSAMRKAMSYLWTMSKESMSAYRAWRIFQGLLQQVCKRYGGPRVLNVRDDAPVPEGWSDTAEASVVAVFSGRP